MSNYKNFSDYNEEAQNIRPTERIQLIQRILNAANIISSLAAGVPLRWANAYKSFQVLVPQESGSPVDYTTAEAISSVDSILYEVESQLLASQDDMNTLTRQLDDVTVTGRANLSSFSSLRPNWNYALSHLSYNGNPYYIFMTTDENGWLYPNKCNLITEAGWNTLSHKSGFGEDSNIINWSTATAGGVWLGHMFGNSANGTYSTDLIISETSNSTVAIAGNHRNNVINQHSCWSFFIDLSTMTLPTGTDQISIYGDPTTNSNLDGALFNEGFSITGEADIEDALGLPDPSNLIGIIHNME